MSSLGRPGSAEHIAEEATVRGASLLSSVSESSEVAVSSEWMLDENHMLSMFPMKYLGSFPQTNPMNEENEV
jgi:hypothetical protein